MKKDELVVYWSPSTEMIKEKNWNILYEDPENCYFDLIKNINKNNLENNFFRCPSFKMFLQNVLIVKNPIESSFIIENNQAIPTSKNYINASIIREPSINNNLLLDYSIGHYFFTEEDVEVFRTPPFFHRPKHYLYGALVPGQWNCGSWFRPIQTEFNLWDNVKEIHFEKDEVLSYLFFNTSKKINLKRFVMNEKIFSFGLSCSSSASWEKNVPLISRYKRFKQSKSDKILLSEIKKNLVD
jgi:hypothetical protein